MSNAKKNTQKETVTESFIDIVHILRTDIEDIISTLYINKAVGPD